MAASTVRLLDGAAAHEVLVDPTRFSQLLLEPTTEGRISGSDLGFALSAPIESQPLEEIVDPGERVLVVVPALAHPAGAARLTSLLVLRLLDLGAAPDEISVLVGRGGRAAVTDDEARALVGDAIPTGIAVRGHDPADAHAVADLGATSRGTPVELNRALVETDHVIATGAIGYHLLQGFSGGPDAFVPAVASARAAAANRRLALDGLARRTGVGPGRLDGNPVYEDLAEAARMLAPSFVVNTAHDAEGEMTLAYAGDWRHAHRRGCAEYAAAHAVAVRARRPIAIVSAGPLGDGSIASAFHAAEHAAGVVTDGGSIVVAAGALGSAEGLSGDPALSDVALAGWGLRALARRFRLMVASNDAERVAEAVGAEAYASVADALAAAGRADGYVIPAALTTLAYVRPPSV